MRVKRRLSPVAALLSLGAGAPALAHDAHVAHFAPGGELMVVRSPTPAAEPWAVDALVEGAEWSAMRWLEAQDAGDADADALEPRVDYLTSLHLGASRRWSDRVSTDLSLPLWLAPVTPDGIAGPGVGDVRVAAPVALVDTNGFGLSLVPLPRLDLPTSSSPELADGARIGGLLAAGVGGERVALAANLGADAGLGEGGPRLEAGLGSRFVASDAVDVAAELVGWQGLAEEHEAADLPLEVLVHAGYVDRRSLRWQLGVGQSLTADNSVPVHRAFLGVSFTPTEAAPEPPPPVERGVVRVIARTLDDRPVQGTVWFDGPKPMDAMPLGDDGVGERELPVGTWRVVISAEGLGTVLRTVELEPGVADVYVIEILLQPGRVELTDTEIVIRDKVQFDFDEATVQAGSLPLLREVAALLIAHPELEHVEVQGHTDDQGDADYNVALSQRRVEAVREVLMDFGVAPERLEARGYGETVPLVSNDTEEGRATNRRVQFVILDTD